MGKTDGDSVLGLLQHEVAPLMHRRATEKNAGRGLKAGHLVRRTQTTILTRLVLVPMHQNNRET